MTENPNIDIVRIRPYLQDHGNAPGGVQLRFNPNMLRRFRQYLALLEEHYDEALLDPEDVIRQELRDTEIGGYATPHVILGAEYNDPDDPGLEPTLLAAASGNVIPFRTREDHTTGSYKAAVQFVSYAVPEVPRRGSLIFFALGGLVSELSNITRLRRRTDEGDVIEADGERAVQVYRSWGFRVLDGVDYVQPPLDWTRDGRPKKEARELTLMWKPVDEDQVTVHNAMLTPFADALFDWYTPEQEVMSDTAYERLEKHVDALRQRFHESIAERTFIDIF